MPGTSPKEEGRIIVEMIDLCDDMNAAKRIVERFREKGLKMVFTNNGPQRWIAETISDLSPEDVVSEEEDLHLADKGILIFKTDPQTDPLIPPSDLPPSSLR